MGDQLRRPFDRSVLADSLQFGAKSRHRASSQIVTAAPEVVSRPFELLGLPLDYGLAQCLQQRWRLELERLGQFLHDIRLAFPRELAQFGQHCWVKSRSSLHLALSIPNWESNRTGLLKRQRPLFRPPSSAFQGRL